MRFAIVSYFDDETTNEIRSIQERIFNITGSRGSLDIWKPHITIGAGVDVSEEKLNKFKEYLSKVALLHERFDLELKNYGFMDNWGLGKSEGYMPFVIYIYVVLNNSLLKLVDDIEEKITNNYTLYYGKLKPYTPHVTVAFKDLGEQGFRKAKSIFSKESISLTSSISHIAIASENENHTWVEYQRFEFK